VIWCRNCGKDKKLLLLREEGLNSRLGSLVSTLSFCHISLSDIFLAHFADSRVMLLPEVFQTTHPDFYIFFAHWALYFAISDDEGCSFLVFLRGR
jgi:hypothetical protein